MKVKIKIFTYIHTYIHNIHTQPWQRQSRKQAKMTHSIIKSIIKQKPARISCVKQSKINVTPHLKITNTTSESDSSSSRSLSSLHRWKSAPIFLPDRNPFVSLIFSYFFFICHLSLSIVNLIISVLCTQIERSPLSISTRHAHLLLIGYRCVLGLSTCAHWRPFSWWRPRPPHSSPMTRNGTAYIIYAKQKDVYVTLSCGDGAGICSSFAFNAIHFKSALFLETPQK